MYEKEVDDTTAYLPPDCRWKTEENGNKYVTITIRLNFNIIQKLVGICSPGSVSFWHAHNADLLAEDFWSQETMLHRNYSMYVVHINYALPFIIR